MRDQSAVYLQQLSKIELVHCSFQFGKIDRLSLEEDRQYFLEKMQHFYSSNCYSHLGIVEKYVENRMKKNLFAKSGKNS